ncbi:MAG: uroporphyrinogen decarboxylase family protein [Candidatus Humimicrobiaceae bacterium]
MAQYYGVESARLSEFIGDNLKYVAYKDPSASFEVNNANMKEYVDEFGVVWDMSEETKAIGDWGKIKSQPLKQASLKGYNFPSPYTKGRFSDFNGLELSNSNKYVILAILGPFDIAWHIRGFKDLMMDFALNHEFVNELLDKALEFNLGIIEQIPSYVDGIRFGEDWGQQKGLIMGPYYWKIYLKPRLKIMYEAAKKRNFNVFIHSCGDIHEIFPDIIEIGVEVVHPVQPEVMNVISLKQNYGKDIVLYGGLGCQSSIPMGTVDDVLKEAKQRLKILGEDGGYIFEPAGAISTETKIENVVALIEFARNKYV